MHASFPQAVVSLPVQYRMAADIQELANSLFYDNALRCGTPAVADSVLALPPTAAAEVLPGLPGWLQQVRSRLTPFLPRLLDVLLLS
jgi:hypothetical protein